MNSKSLYILETIFIVCFIPTYIYWWVTGFSYLPDIFDFFEIMGDPGLTALLYLFTIVVLAFSVMTPFYIVFSYLYCYSKGSPNNYPKFLRKRIASGLNVKKLSKFCSTKGSIFTRIQFILSRILPSSVTIHTSQVFRISRFSLFNVPKGITSNKRRDNFSFKHAW